ncbi:outer membrane beta-barrel protein [Flavobacterium sp. 5]|uniref:outer membrane beta-barrel protein n=1 Tax=Flavobacterium sp. 5 TaxID=2035199 RepID=UPI000C2C32DE|nr:outer membrane beta-barrel protein [Flavobacterium sp. 5]PKB18266.1 outer membrane receptor for ferrienterochelin and colicin [Flavobacterium sp. 5]
MRYFFFISILFLSLISTAQTTKNKGSITAKVIDSQTRVPIEMAIVSIYKAEENKPFNGVTTDQKGHFTFNNLSEGTYRIGIEFISYKVFFIEKVTINTSSNNLNFGEVLLVPIANELSGVTVTSKAASVQSKIDKLVYNPVNDLSSQGGVATDILKNVPMVSVDIDGKVELQGSPNVRFLINGKPSSIFGASVSDALQSIPASQIKNIEVITSPGAKYDAAGTGGIINIILKENKVQGINSSVNLSLGTRLENGSFNLNAKKGNFGSGIYFGGNKQLNTITRNSSDRTSYNPTRDTISSLHQNGKNPFTRSSYQTGLNLNWSITEKDELSATLGFNHFENNSTGTTLQNQQSYLTDGSLLSILNSERKSAGSFKNDATDWSISYKKTFDKKDQELNVLVTSSSGKSINNSSQETIIQEDNSVSGNRNYNPGKNHELNLSVDFTYPLAEGFTFETGAKSTFENIESQVVSDTLSNGNVYINDLGQSYNFIYKRNIYAVYFSSSYTLFNGFLEGQAGLRYEKTNTTADFAGVNIPDYDTFAPSFVMQHKISDSQSIKFSYTFRIERPDFEDLNPFFNISDPHNISTGNPFLKTEKGNRYELGYSKNFDNNANFYFSGYYRYNTEDIQNLTTFYNEFGVGKTTYTDVTLTRRYNIGSETTYGASLFGSLPVNKKGTIKGTFDFGERTNSTPGFASVNSFIYRANLNLSYKFSPDMMGEIVGNYRSTQKSIQGERPASFFYNIAFRKQFLNKNASVGITMANPFNNYLNQRSSSYGDSFYQVNNKDIPVQSFGISLSYKFGKLDFKKGESENHEGPLQPEI